MEKLNEKCLEKNRKWAYDRVSKSLQSREIKGKQQVFDEKVLSIYL